VESNAVLECRSCQSLQFMPLSPIEVEVLQTSGILTKLCAQCQTTGPWSYSGRQIAAAGPERSSAESRGNSSAGGVRGRERRRHRRVPLQLPIRIRDYAGGVEITQSENISKGGLGFASGKKYQIGEGLMVTCPYQSSGENIEVRAHVVSTREVEGSSRRIYGIRFARRGP
jgi:PilZ domain